MTNERTRTSGVCSLEKKRAAIITANYSETVTDRPSTEHAMRFEANQANQCVGTRQIEGKEGGGRGSGAEE